jgi:iron only hydrogenase large subunit-like protein
MKDPRIQDVRGGKGRKEVYLEIGGAKYGFAVVSGLANARALLEEIRGGRTDIHFIEVMTCPGGCVAGGGQFLGVDIEAVRRRAQKLYYIDRDEFLRFSHKNEEVQRLYTEFLGEPLGRRSHELLHTHYHERKDVLV